MGIKVRLEKIYHRDNWQIALFFKYDETLNRNLRSIGATYSINLKCWYLSYSKQSYDLLKNIEGITLILPESQNKSGNQVAGPKALRENPPIASNGELQCPEPPSQANTAHKPPQWADKYPDLVLMESVGKYWLFKLKFRSEIVKQLLATKGVYWNKTYKCYMAMQHENVRTKVHQILGCEFLPSPTSLEVKEKPTNAYIKAHPADNKLMQVHLPKKTWVLEAIKRFPFSMYSKATDAYLLPAVPEVMQSVKDILEPKLVSIISHLPEGYLKLKNMPKRKHLDLTKSRTRLLMQVPQYHRQSLELFIDIMMAKNYSPSTIKTYGNSLIRLMRDHPNQDPADLNERQVIRYLSGLMQKGLLSASGNTMVNAIKFYYREVLKRNSWELDIPRPKGEKKLPAVLTKEECSRLFNSIENTKHKLILMMTYGTGMRVSEIVTLKWRDILYNEYKIHIKNAKGKKDRMVMLPLLIMEQLTSYRATIKRNKPSDYVFEGSQAGEPYSSRSVQQIMRQAREKSAIDKKASVHTLRHSFGTHLLEGGTDIRYIQGFLGHADIKTTTVYTHLTKSKVATIASPLDSLDMDTDHRNTTTKPQKAT